MFAIPTKIALREAMKIGRIVVFIFIRTPALYVTSIIIEIHSLTSILPILR